MSTHVSEDEDLSASSEVSEDVEDEDMNVDELDARVEDLLSGDSVTFEEHNENRS
jgi:hypothetical protein